MKHITFFNISLALLLFISINSFAQSSRAKTNFDFDWKFTIGDDPQYSETNYTDIQWEDIQLPHDWNIGMKFDIKEGGSPAYLPESIGWYRKRFTVPAKDAGKKISILFDGIFQQSDVYINGQFLGFRPYGFCSIEYDLTPYLKTDAENIIAVRVNCTGGRPRWYAGSGIYRHAWLVKVDPVHIPTYGTYITTPFVNNEYAEVQIISTVANTSDKIQQISISQCILDSSGKQAGKPDITIAGIEANGTTDIKQILTLPSPKRWNINNPVLYTMETTVKAGGKVTDIYTTPFGVRTFSFDADKGFSLNGRPVKLKGMCLHQDAGSLGVAVPDRSYERRLEILKEYGCNAIRCAHNQPSPEFLDMCDRMGFVVIDEAFDKWKSGYYEKYFDEWWQRDLNNMLLRDRNHPSVVLWSIGNEVQEAWDGSDEGVQRAKMLQDFVHRQEPSRPVILAAQNNHQAKFSGVTDVIGYNYLEARMLSDHQKYPERRFLITEELPYYSGEEGNIRAYDTNNPWNIIAENDFVGGGFIWSGVDYLGEAGWPGKGWPNGLFDVCMFEKPRAAFHRAMWNDKPMVRIAVIDQSLDIEPGRDLWQWPRMAAHWNFPPAYDELIMEVLTTTNCERVELYQNDKLMGSKKTSEFPNHTIVWNIPYKHGKLTAKGYNGDLQVTEYTLKTSGNTDHPVLSPDRTTIKADGQDLSHIAVHLEDAEGNKVQTDDKLLTVTVEGDGRFLGIDNGDLRRENSFAGNSLKTYFGQALIVVQSHRNPGKIIVNVTMEGSDKIYSVEILCK